MKDKSFTLECAVCGKKFIAHAPSVKYCSPECRKKGTYEKRKKWESDTGFKEKQKQKMRLKREGITAEEKRKQLEEEKRKQRNLKRRQTRRIKKRQSELEYKADQGDYLAKMELEEDICTIEYWKAYKGYCLQFAEELGEICLHFVNGISIQEENFELLVVESIKETGTIIENQFFEPIPKEDDEDES